MTETTLVQLTTFILTEATDSDVQRLEGALRDRRKALATTRAAAVVVGAQVTTRGLNPKFMNGLSGTVAKIETTGRGARRGQYAYLTLDERSTEELRWQASTRFPVPHGVTTFTMSAGIPLECLDLTAQDSSTS
jgi:hypothetical protein